jgi:hypothetical protein
MIGGQRDDRHGPAGEGRGDLAARRRARVRTQPRAMKPAWSEQFEPAALATVTWRCGARIRATGNSFTPVQLTGLIERVLGKHPDLA